MEFNWINTIIIFLLSISTLIGILDFVGFLPSGLRKKLRINRADDLISVLHDLGVNVDQIQRVNKSFQYPRNIDTKEIEVITKNAVEQHKITKDLVVGHYRKTAVSFYFDLLGATCSPDAAQYFANILSSYWASQIKKPYNIKHIDFDFVVTPKGGSPLLGYEFSKLVQKPFILHEETPRFESSSDDMRQSFNCYEYPPKGAIMLIVDDSTTGGTMVCKTVDDLRKFGYLVSTCLVVFEPQSKNARQKLADKNVQLVSVIKTH